MVLKYIIWSKFVIIKRVKGLIRWYYKIQNVLNAFN